MTAYLRCRRVPSRRAPWRIAAVALVAAAGLPALSAGQSPAASVSEPPAAVAPGRGEPPMVLVLPLASATYGRAAAAVKAGFLTAADAANVRPAVISHGDGDVLVAFAQAAKTGARVIVGPLVRDDLRTLATAGITLPLTLALNQLDDGIALPPNMYALALAIDSEARQLARHARDAGATSVAVIGSDTPLQKRFAVAFIDAWLLLGGAAPVSLHFDRTPDMLALLRRELARTPVDAVLLAVDGADAALVKPYVRAAAAYAGSQVNDRQPREALRDLDDVRFVEIPWLAEPDASAFAGIPRPDFPNAAFDRLYALGLDAFRAAQALADGRTEALEFEGATGRLALERSRQFAREGRMLQFRAGEIAPVLAR